MGKWIECRSCVSGVVVELLCAQCDVVKALSGFTKAQRRDPDRAVSELLSTVCHQDRYSSHFPPSAADHVWQTSRNRTQSCWKRTGWTITRRMDMTTTTTTTTMTLQTIMKASVNVHNQNRAALTFFVVFICIRIGGRGTSPGPRPERTYS